MKDTFRKAFLSLVGAAAVTAEKANEMIDEFVKKGEITVDEGKKLAKELQEKAEVAQGEFTQKVKKEVENTMSKLGYVKKEEFDNLKNELEKLKSKVSGEPKPKRAPVKKKATEPKNNQ
jgi:polyhydroxyalkanoate synthesis regulator phasin